MTSLEIRQAIDQGENITELLVHVYIGDFVKKLGLEETQVVVFDKPITEKARPDLYREPVRVLGMNAMGQYTFEKNIDSKEGTPKYGIAIVDLLESLEKGQYKIY